EEATAILVVRSALQRIRRTAGEAQRGIRSAGLVHVVRVGGEAEGEGLPTRTVGLEPGRAGTPRARAHVDPSAKAGNRRRRGAVTERVGSDEDAFDDGQARHSAGRAGRTAPRFVAGDRVAEL